MFFFRFFICSKFSFLYFVLIEHKLMAEDTTGSGTRAQREDSTIQRVPYSSLEEQQEMDRRRDENATLGSQGKKTTFLLSLIEK
jgi:hypothetical protein